MLNVAAFEYYHNKVFMKVCRRRLRDNLDPFDVPDERFRELYRFPRSLAMNFLAELSIFMIEDNALPEVPLSTQFCTALNFFASGSYQRRVGQDALCMLSQSSVCKCIRSISCIIATKMMNEYARFPQSVEEIEELTKGFQEIADFPGVFGVIDGTQICLTAMLREIEHVFVNHKGFHSLNTQVIIDSKMRFINVNARYPGATHDSLIWASSLACSFLERTANQMGERWNYFLLGDSGYPLQPWLLKPYDAPSTPAEKQYNINHRRLRSLVERAIGLLKARFRCLLQERKLRYNPLKSGYIIYSCVVLHNFLLDNSFPVDDLEPIIDEPIIDFEQQFPNDYLEQGRQMRDFMCNYFEDRRRQ